MVWGRKKGVGCHSGEKFWKATVSHRQKNRAEKGAGAGTVCCSKKMKRADVKFGRGASHTGGETITSELKGESSDSVTREDVATERIRSNNRKLEVGRNVAGNCKTRLGEERLRGPVWRELPILTVDEEKTRGIWRKGTGGMPQAKGARVLSGRRGRRRAEPSQKIGQSRSDQVPSRS